MLSDRATDHLDLRSSHQQGRGAMHFGGSVPADTRLGGTVLAHGAWSREGQPVEPRSVSVRIGRPPYLLGARRDGSMDAAHRGLASTAASWMAWRCARCSIERL